jgi:hypothetical protein
LPLPKLVVSIATTAEAVQHRLAPLTLLAGRYWRALQPINRLSIRDGKPAIINHGELSNFTMLSGLIDNPHDGKAHDFVMGADRQLEAVANPKELEEAIAVLAGCGKTRDSYQVCLQAYRKSLKMGPALAAEFDVSPVNSIFQQPASEFLVFEFFSADEPDERIAIRR